MYVCTGVYVQEKNANLNLVGLPLPAQEPFCNQPILFHPTPPHPTTTSNLSVQRNTNVIDPPLATASHNDIKFVRAAKHDEKNVTSAQGLHRRPHQKRDSLLFGTGSHGRKFIVHKIPDLQVKGVMTCCSVDFKRYLHLRPSMLAFNFERFVNQFLAFCVRAHMHIDRGL